MITSPTGKEQRLRPVRVNAGVEADYRRRLRALVVEMGASIAYWLLAEWDRKEDVIGMAVDAGPSRVNGLKRTLKDLRVQWVKVFSDQAEVLARRMAKGAQSTTEVAMQAALKDAGWTIKFTPTVATQEAYRAVLAEQVSLIKSIPAQHLARVEEIVWNSVMRGYDRGALASALRKQLGVADRRAAFIARDQTAKAKSVMERQRVREVGITEGIWRHSHGGREPRPSHVKADGKRFDLSKGMYLDGKWTWPGMEPNCGCTFTAVIPALDRIRAAQVR